ncbi:MAG: DUF3794 domain-containing protein [Candidatus Choladocola sp.]|nr:DUF3794 domain-containing protein [Candidatus Choladocola sp.]
MDLLMKNIHMCRQAKRAGTQITLDEDLNVPDTKPDVEMIIQSRDHISLDHMRAESGKLFVDGSMEVSILYMDDTKEHQLHRLDTKLTFEETIAMDGLEAGDNIRLRYETEDLNVALINSRKLAIRGLVTFEASVDEIYDMSAGVETQGQTKVCERRKKLELMQLAVRKKDILRLKEEIPLPSNKPNITEILWDDVQLRSTRTQLQDGRLLVSGSLFLFVLYRGEDETQSVQWLEQTVPFSGEVECSGCTQSLVPDIETALASAELTAKEDTDGELRLFHMEGVLELEICLYGTEEAEILEDVYSPEKDLELVTSEEVYESLVMRNESKCRAGARIRIQSAKPRILQICHSSGSIKIDKTVIVEDGIQIEGAVPVSILYISSDDTMPFAVLEGTVPFSHLAEIPGIDRDCRFTVSTNLDQLLATMADSEEIEVKVSVGLNIFAARQGKQQCIHEIREKEYELERLERVPGITGYLVQGTETLWDIAKQYYLTPEQIMEMNGLESDRIKKGDCLILMKSVVMAHAKGH